MERGKGIFTIYEEKEIWVCPYCASKFGLTNLYPPRCIEQVDSSDDLQRISINEEFDGTNDNSKMICPACLDLLEKFLAPIADLPEFGRKI